MKTSRLRSTKGFTLIELIIVIALLGIMITFTVPKFNTTFFDNDINASTRWFISNVPALKEKAKTTRTNYLLNINMDVNQLWITAENMPDE
ncbi:MAG: type II secretion system GspH family protein [Desulfobacterales bacterium]|nr:type II secretion system GspH family protein [Desulfobacterales bacterium]